MELKIIPQKNAPTRPRYVAPPPAQDRRSELGTLSKCDCFRTALDAPPLVGMMFGSGLARCLRTPTTQVSVETLLARAARCQHTPIQCLHLLFSVIDIDIHPDLLLGIYLAEVVGAGADAISLLMQRANNMDGKTHVFRHSAMGAIHGGHRGRIALLLRDKDANLVAEQFTASFLQTGDAALMQWAMDSGWIDLTPYIHDPGRARELRKTMSVLTAAGEPAPFAWLEANGLTIPSYVTHMACDIGKHAILVWLLDRGYRADDMAWCCAVTEGNEAVLDELYARNGGYVPSHLHCSLRDRAENLIRLSSGEWLTAHGVP